MDTFDALVKFLRKNGYRVTVAVMPYDPIYRFAQIRGKWIKGGFCEFSNHQTHLPIDERIAFDNEKCFDKWSKCPFSLPLPVDEKQMKYILKQMKFLATNKGYKLSNSYDLPTIKDYPKIDE